MFNQTFTYTDIVLVLFLALVEIFLSADNAVAIASLASKLEREKQSKALWIGFLSGIILRLLVIVLASYFIKFSSIQMLGGTYLIYIGIAHFFRKKEEENAPKIYPSFFKTVFLIELTDLIFAIDSILAAFAIVGVKISGNGLPSKIWIVYLGGVIGMFFMRTGASLLLRWLNTLPNLKSASHLLIILVGCRMLLIAIFHQIDVHHQIEVLFNITFWLGCFGLLLYAVRRRA